MLPTSLNKSFAAALLPVLVAMNAEVKAGRENPAPNLKERLGRARQHP